ncbi:MAG: hypothetical protein ACK41O_26855, partial [Runella zeae]
RFLQILESSGYDPQTTAQIGLAYVEAYPLSPQAHVLASSVLSKGSKFSLSLPSLSLSFSLSLFRSHLSFLLFF